MIIPALTKEPTESQARQAARAGFSAQVSQLTERQCPYDYDDTRRPHWIHGFRVALEQEPARLELLGRLLNPAPWPTPVTQETVSP